MRQRGYSAASSVISYFLNLYRDELMKDHNSKRAILKQELYQYEDIVLKYMEIRGDAVYDTWQFDKFFRKNYTPVYDENLKLLGYESSN